MKIRTDFVTNSSSSSYCTVTINDGNKDAFGRSRRMELTYEGFYTFWFNDPTEKLKQADNLDALFDAILYSTGAADRVFNPDHFRNQVKEIGDFSNVKSIEIECYEEINDRDWDDPEPRTVWYTYDFESGEKTARSDCAWQRYKGYGDSLAPDVRDADGEQLPFAVEEVKGRQCVLDYESETQEITIPEVVFVNGNKTVIQGLGQWCFDEAYDAEVINLPNTIEYIAPNAFEGCLETLKQIRVEGADPDKPFEKKDGTKLDLVIYGGTEYAIPDDITELGETAFGGCWNLKTIVLHDGMKKPTKTALSSAMILEEVVLPDGSKIHVADDEAKKCFTISKGVIGYNYKKCAEAMLDAGNAAEFKWAVETGGLTGETLDEFYGKIKLKRKPEFKAMKEFLLEKGAKK